MQCGIIIMLTKSVAIIYFIERATIYEVWLHVTDTSHYLDRENSEFTGNVSVVWCLLNL